jgi:hypothetical protein
MSFKLWKWRISIKIKSLDAEKKISFLANALISSMQEAGNQIALPDISEGFGSLTVSVHNVGKEIASGHVNYQSGKHHINFVPAFGELKVFKED